MYIFTSTRSIYLIQYANMNLPQSVQLLNWTSQRITIEMLNEVLGHTNRLALN